MSCEYRRSKEKVLRKPLRAFTLIELLVVLFIFMILIAVSLPIVKGLVSDQKTSRTAQSLEAFINAARSRAIGEGRTVGVRFERLGTANFQRSTCLRVRQLVGVPAYSGDAVDATAILSGSPINTAVFDTADSPLLYLSASILNTAPTTDDYLSPIKPGDLLELPGGRTVPIGSIGAVVGSSVTVTFNLSEVVNLYGSVNVNRFPLAGVLPSAGGAVKYQIHRRPTPSSSKTLSMPRGMAIDLNYSGFGVTGNQFAPPTDATVIPHSVDLLFDANGAVSQVIVNTSTSNARTYPTGLIFFCIGEIDGIASVEGATSADRENLFSADRTLTTNVMKSDSLWLVVNPISGQTSTVGNASIVTIPTDPNDPTTIAFGVAMQEARILATYSDSITE